MLFVWHTGEEKGLLGSRYFTDHPTVPRDSIVAQINIDMVGRGGAYGSATPGAERYLQLVGSRRLSTELGDLVETVNKTRATPFTFDYTFDANGHPDNIYCRSDHSNYARYGIPVVFFTTGLHGDYHQVTDEPQYIDYAHMANRPRSCAISRSRSPTSIIAPSWTSRSPIRTLPAGNDRRPRCASARAQSRDELTELCRALEQLMGGTRHLLARGALLLGGALTCCAAAAWPSAVRAIYCTSAAALSAAAGSSAAASDTPPPRRASAPRQR